MNEQNKKLPANPMAFLIRNRLIKVTPGNQGKNCLAFRPGAACACDECQYQQECWMIAIDGDKTEGMAYD